MGYHSLAIHPLLATRVKEEVEEMATSGNRSYVKHPTMVLSMRLNAPITPTAENKFLFANATITKIIVFLFALIFTANTWAGTFDGI